MAFHLIETASKQTKVKKFIISYHLNPKSIALHVYILYSYPLYCQTISEKAETQSSYKLNQLLIHLIYSLITIEHATFFVIKS